MKVQGKKSSRTSAPFRPGAHNQAPRARNEKGRRGGGTPLAVYSTLIPLTHHAHRECPHVGIYGESGMKRGGEAGAPHSWFTAIHHAEKAE